MRRRTFLHRCGLLAAGSVFVTALTGSHGQLCAAEASAQGSRQMTRSDRALLRLLSAYSTDAYFWGGQVFARATGSGATGSTNLLVRVGDYSRLVAFLRSDSIKMLGKVIVTNNTLSFTYRGAAYTVTNEGAEGFSRAVAGGGVTRDHGTEAAGVFAHQAMLYHPATDTLSDPYLAVVSKRLDLAAMPTGGVKARVQTLLQGWLEARRLGVDFGASFKLFQKEILNYQPTTKAASKVIGPLLGHLSELAGLYNVDELGSLLLTPLIGGSLREALGLDVEQVVAEAKALRAETATVSYPDAAIWLATLLPSQIEAGTADEWLQSSEDDASASAATRAALRLAKQLVQTLAAEPR